MSNDDDIVDRVDITIVQGQIKLSLHRPSYEYYLRAPSSLFTWKDAGETGRRR